MSEGNLGPLACPLSFLETIRANGLYLLLLVTDAE
jgi:hypothetical protein